MTAPWGCTVVTCSFAFTYLYCSAFCIVSVLAKAWGGSGSDSPELELGDWKSRTFFPPGDDIPSPPSSPSSPLSDFNFLVRGFMLARPPCLLLKLRSWSTKTVERRKSLVREFCSCPPGQCASLDIARNFFRRTTRLARLGGTLARNSRVRHGKQDGDSRAQLRDRVSIISAEVQGYLHCAMVRGDACCAVVRPECVGMHGLFLNLESAEFTTVRLVCCRRLFPETRDLLDEEQEVSTEFAVTNTEIASSLPLQMLLYFNVQYSIFWGLITLALMVFKVGRDHFDSAQQHKAAA